VRTSSVTPGLIIFLMGLLGVISAFIEKTFYDEGVGVNALSNMNITLTEVMVLTIAIWLLVGCVVALWKA
jgi:hypothetical protein